MIFMREYAELSVDQTKSTTSTLENVIVPKDITLFKEFAQNVNLMKLIMNILRHAVSLLAQESMNSTHQSLILVSVNQDTSKLEEFVPTAALDNIMTHSLIDVFASQDIKNIKETVNQFVLQEQLTSTENVSVPTECQFIMENVQALRNAHFILIGIKKLIAVFVMQDTELSTEDAAAINIVVSMDILNTDNAIAMMDITGFFMLVENVVSMKLSMELPVNAILDIIEITMEFVSRATLSLNVMKTKDMMMFSRHVFV